MSYVERPVLFACEGETLVGMLSSPTDTMAASDTGLVVIVGGPQYRAGSHRQFLLLSRHLATAGVPVLRFDVRGMGDSTGALRTFEDITPDIAAAIDTLQQQAPHLQRVVLWGLCDGASGALLYCHAKQDNRVRGLCLVNPWVRSQQSLARAHIKHYYGDRFRQKEFWMKLLSGKVAGGALTDLWSNLLLTRKKQVANTQIVPFQQRMASAWEGFEGRILLILSGNDYTAKEFLEYVKIDGHWAGLLERQGVQRQDVPNADHTCSSSHARATIEGRTLAWTLQKAI